MTTSSAFCEKNRKKEHQIRNSFSICHQKLKNRKNNKKHDELVFPVSVVDYEVACSAVEICVEKATNIIRAAVDPRSCRFQF